MDNIGMVGIDRWIKFIWEGHLANPLWADRLSRRVRRENAYGEMKMSYLRKYLPFVEKLKAPLLSETSSADDKVFSLWFQGEGKAPEVVRKCLDRLREKFGEKFILLDNGNLWDHVSLPDFIVRKWEEKRIIPANFSDIVRIDLLLRHGGYWFDATDFITGDIPEVIREAPFFMYVTGEEFFSYMFVQTCFMRGKQGDPLMAMWQQLIYEYWENEEKAVDYFLVHILLKFLVAHNKEAATLFSKMPKLIFDPTHRLWHEIGDMPFDKALYEQMKEDAFFQKCSYKPQRHGVNQIIPGSMADYVINGKA